MEKLKLTNAEREDLKAIINIEKSILETEKEIIELEAKEEQNSDKYQTTIHSLKSTLDLEENLLSKLFSSSDRIIVFFTEYGDPLNTNDFSKQLATFITPGEDKLTITRIINYFFNKIVYDKNDNGNNHLHGVAVNQKTGKAIPINPNAILQLENTIKSDIIYTIINLLNTEIKNCQNYELKRLLIKSKYNLLFMFPNSEKNFINNPNTSDELYISNKFIAEYYKILEGLYHSVLFKTTKPLFNLSVNPLANMDSLDFKNNKHLGIIYTTLLRTCLIINEEDFYDSLKEQISFQTIILNKPNTEGVNHICNILEQLKEDRKIPKTITLALKKED